MIPRLEPDANYVGFYAAIQEEDEKDRAKELVEIEEEKRLAEIRRKEEEEQEERERILRYRGNFVLAYLFWFLNIWLSIHIA